MSVLDNYGAIRSSEDPVTELKRVVGERLGLAAPAKTSKQKVYELAEKMVGAHRRDVVETAIRQGVHPSTALNHYHNWKTSRDN